MTEGIPVICAVDGSKHSADALELAIDLAKLREQPLIVVHVQRAHGSSAIPEDLEEYERFEHVRITEADLLRSAATRIARTATDKARASGVAAEAIVLEGDPADRIVGLARERGAGMIVLGSRGLSDLGGLFLGSVSHKVAHLAPCSCVIAR